MIIYRDITETMNKSKFKCYVPDEYEFVVPKYYRDNPHLAPIYNNDGGYSLTMVSINQLIQIACDGVDFYVYNREDFITIQSILEEYTKELAQAVKHAGPNSEASVYFSRCMKTLGVLKDPVDIAKIRSSGESKLPKTAKLSDLLNSTKFMF